MVVACHTWSGALGKQSNHLLRRRLVLFGGVCEGMWILAAQACRRLTWTSRPLSESKSWRLWSSVYPESEEAQE